MLKYTFVNLMVNFAVFKMKLSRLCNDNACTLIKFAMFYKSFFLICKKISDGESCKINDLVICYSHIGS